MEKNSLNITSNNTGVPTQLIHIQSEGSSKDDLLAMLGHELKAPLSTIKLYIQMVMNEAKSSRNLEAAGLLKHADRQVNEMTAIIDNILDMSMISSGKSVLNVHHFDISILIQEVLCYLFQGDKTHDVKATCAGVQNVCADRSKIKQVIQNLLSNAIKYSPEKSAIQISSVSVFGQLQVSVRDNGMGISAIHQKQIFKRFYRAESIEIKGKNGYGIGLYLVREIIRQHNGLVWVDSVEGLGSAFHFSLPIK